MSATRLLVLGVVRLFQPAHGYAVRRELLSWEVDSWAAVNPGSIYNMLRTLTREGLLAEVDSDGRGGGPARVSYRLTMDGENVFAGLLARALWDVDERDPFLLLAALCFLPSMTRRDAAEALEAREAALQLRIRAINAKARLLAEKQTVPPHTAELFSASAAHLEGELGWVRDARRRIAEGYYRFAGEAGADAGPHEGRWYGPLDAYAGGLDRS